MKIGIYCGTPPKLGSGIQVYIKNLINGILGLTSRTNLSLIFTIARHPLKSSDYRMFATNINKSRFPLPEKVLLKLWNNFKFPPLNILGHNFDIVHSLTSYLPPVKHMRTIVTVHDLIPITHPKLSLFSGEKAKMIINSVKDADLIIADSINTQKDVVKLLNIEESRVIVVYPGIDPIFEVKIDERSIKKTLGDYNIDFPYFLFTGLIDSRKNIRRLIIAFAEFIKKRKAEEKLVLVGARTFRSKEELSIIEDLGLRERVIYLGYVSRDDMPALYAGAKFFVFPTLYEGFGFPVLEAMACGVPVITSNTSSLPEICGDAAYYVSPNSVDSIIDAIDVVYHNEDLRLEMINKGFKRVQLFQWQHTASETMKCYSDLMGEKSL